MKKTANAKQTPKEPKATEVDPRFVPVVDAFARSRDVSRGMMMASYGLKVGGKIFAMFGKGRFVVKLPRARVEELASAGQGERFDPGHGRLMKEWIVIGEGRDWVELAREAYRFVKTGAAEPVNVRLPAVKRRGAAPAG